MMPLFARRQATPRHPRLSLTGDQPPVEAAHTHLVERCQVVLKATVHWTCHVLSAQKWSPSCLQFVDVRQHRLRVVRVSIPVKGDDVRSFELERVQLSKKALI